jgi:hypothetical protein
MFVAHIAKKTFIIDGIYYALDLRFAKHATNPKLKLMLGTHDML